LERIVTYLALALKTVTVDGLRAMAGARDGA
jgi:hypothetical protein